MKELDEPSEVEIDDLVAEGVYINRFFMSSTPEEFLIDFAQAYPGCKSPVIRSRIVMTPETAKRLAIILHDHINHFEQNVREIDPDLGFSGGNNFEPKGNA